MSWDAVILRIRGPFRPIADVEEGDFLPLGTNESVAKGIRQAFPAARWHGKTHALCSLDDYTSIEFDLKYVEETKSLHIRVTGSSDPIPSLLSFASAHGWLVLDCQNSDFIDPADPSREGWEGYRWLVEQIPDDEPDGNPD